MATDTEQEVVRTRVPSYQSAEWRAHAEELGMNRSEFVRSMVQAGRRGFATADEPGSEDATPRGEDLETQVLDELDGGVRTWEELVEALTETLETTLQDLQREGRVQYNGRHGGYRKNDE